MKNAKLTINYCLTAKNGNKAKKILLQPHILLLSLDDKFACPINLERNYP